jgi:hypothetical protein
MGIVYRSSVMLASRGTWGGIMWAVARRPSSLTAALARDIPPYIRDRGEKYVRTGRVAALEWAETRIACKVQGSEVYVVGLSRSENAIAIGCTCPYYLDRGPCKHVWAVAVVIDQDPRWDGSWLEGGPLIDFESGIDDPYYEAAVIDGGGGPEFLPARTAARKPRKHPDPVTEAAQAAVNRLAELRQQLLAGSALAGVAPREMPPIPPPDSQLIFILDAAGTKASGMLMVHTATRKRAADNRP